MLRHQTIALALFLSAGCELAGAPDPEKPTPATAVTPPTEVTRPAPAPVAEPAPVAAPGVSARVVSTEPAEPREELRPMSRLGPSWGKQKPRFKVAAPSVAATPAADRTPPDAATLTPSK